MKYLLFLVFLVLGVGSVAAQEWSQWRGPTRDGIVPAAVIPKQWPKATKRAWQVDIGEGYSSPVVANGRAFLHSRRDPEEIVTAIDLASGKVAWQQKYTAAFTKNQYATAMAKGPNSTPLVAGGRLFTLGVTGILTAWNVADGDDRLAAGLFSVHRHVEIVLRHGHVADDRRRFADRPGRQRRARRPRARARSGHRQ